MAIIVMCAQSIFGVIIQACLAGIVFAKFTVPTKRGETIIFSKNAIVSLRNGALYLLVQVSCPKLSSHQILFTFFVQLTDLRKSSLIEAHVRMILVKTEETKEGEVIPFYRTDLECSSEIDAENDRVGCYSRNPLITTPDIRLRI